MRDEIQAAVIFLIRLISKSNTLAEERLNRFKDNLIELLTKKYESHWFPEKPNRGQAYRCIRVNESCRRETVLEDASKMSGIKYDQLDLPVELTLWVDPKEVTCRFGEHEGSYCVIADFKEEGKLDSNSDKITVESIEKECLKKSNQGSSESIPNVKKEEVTTTSHENYGKKPLKSNGISTNNNTIIHNNNSSGYSPRIMNVSSPTASVATPVTTAPAAYYSQSTEFYTNLEYSPHHYASSPSHQSTHRTPLHRQNLLEANYHHQPTISPPNHQLRGLPYRVSPTDFANLAIGTPPNNNNNSMICGKFSRSLQNAFNNAALSADTFQSINDRYYWMNKSIVKA